MPLATSGTFVALLLQPSCLLSCHRFSFIVLHFWGSLKPITFPEPCETSDLCTPTVWLTWVQRQAMSKQHNYLYTEMFLYRLNPLPAFRVESFVLAAPALCSKLDRLCAIKLWSAAMLRLGLWKKIKEPRSNSHPKLCLVNPFSVLTSSCLGMRNSMCWAFRHYSIALISSSTTPRKTAIKNSSSVQIRMTRLRKVTHGALDFEHARLSVQRCNSCAGLDSLCPDC